MSRRILAKYAILRIGRVAVPPPDASRADLFCRFFIVPHSGQYSATTPDTTTGWARFGLRSAVRAAVNLRGTTRSDNFIERKLDYADGAGLEQLGEKLTHGTLRNHRFDRAPFLTL